MVHESVRGFDASLLAFASFEQTLIAHLASSGDNYTAVIIALCVLALIRELIVGARQLSRISNRTADQQVNVRAARPLAMPLIDSSSLHLQQTRSTDVPKDAEPLSGLRLTLTHLNFTQMFAGYAESLTMFAVFTVSVNVTAGCTAAMVHHLLTAVLNTVRQQESLSSANKQVALPRTESEMRLIDGGKISGLLVTTGLLALVGASTLSQTQPTSFTRWDTDLVDRADARVLLDGAFAVSSAVVYVAMTRMRFVKA